MEKVVIKIKDWDADAIDNDEESRKPVKVNMWYDRHLRLWEIWTVDADGNQWDESRYGANKTEAIEIKKELEEQIASGEYVGDSVKTSWNI